jgi:cytoskeletal protein RodZ
MTLDDVARATKITTRMLSALEQEKFDQLPGGIFNKGFVRAYARHLGLDEEQALRDYAQAAPHETVIKTEDAELRAIAEKKDKERTNRPQSRQIPWGMVAALLLILAIGLSVWGFFSREQNISSQTRPSISRETVARGSFSTSRPKSPPNPPLPTEVVSTQIVSESSAEDSSPSTVVSTSSAEPINLVVSAHQDSWLTITVDGQPFYQGNLVSGAEKTVAAHNEVVLRSGNIGGVDIAFNGTRLPAQGGEAEVKTLVFGPAGLIDNAGAKPSD